MRFKCCVLVNFLTFCCFVLEIAASSCSQELALLPKIFYLNETEECPDDHLYCKVDVKLRPQHADNPPALWKEIQKQFVYQRDTVYRAFCIGSESIEQKLAHELYEYNLKGEVIKSYCYRKQRATGVFGSYDIFIWIFVSTYLGFIIYSTAKTYSSNNNANRYQQMFSLINIWKELNEPKRNEDFKNLRSIQGMRTLAMAYIVAVHSVFTSMVVMFIKNPEYFDEVPHNLVKSIFHGSFGLVVQIYFVISAWLLAVQLQNIVRKNGEFKIKDLFILWLNRYFRLLPAIALLLLLHCSDAIAVAVSHPYFYSLARSEVTRCRVIWWKNLLFLQNINVQENEICSPGMWYLAADLHMYIVSSTIFYVSRRFKISMKYLLGLIGILVVSIQIFNVLTTDFDGLLRFSTRLLPAESMISKPELIVSYIQTYGSAGTYIIGFVFGTFYSYNKNKTIFDTTMKKTFCYVTFFGMPILTSYLVGFRTSREVEAFLAVSLRPLFSFGIAVGLLNMAAGGGGFLKTFFESSPMVFLGNFTYSIYMFHFVIVFGRSVFWARYIELTDLYCCGIWVMDLILSFALGMFMYLILEHPFIRLQKRLIPQLHMGRVRRDSKKE